MNWVNNFLAATFQSGRAFFGCDTTIQDLLADSLNDLFAEHGKPEIAPAQTQHPE